MASNTDIIALLSTEADKAVDQIIVDSKRLHQIVNGTGTEQAVTEDGSLIPSVRKAMLDNLYFKTPPLPWRTGSSVSEFNQLYSFSDVNGNVTWWYAPGATVANPVVMRDSPINDGKFRVFLDKTNIADIYAPITSPDFKGNPRVPLATAGDDTSTIASTQWVQREMKALVDLVTQATKGEFQDITVVRDSVLKNLYVSGEFIVTSPKLAAPTTEATFQRVRVVSTDAEIAFEQNGAPPVDITTKTNIKPYAVATGKATVDSLTAGRAKVGDVAVSTDSLDVDGYIRGDYLHLEGNSRNEATRPQLVVDGIAEIKTLRVTDKVEGLKADVDGLDIKPRSATIDEGLQVAKDTDLKGKLTVAGKTKVADLEVTGTLTGVAVNVDGKDIKPRSVETAGSANVKGNLNIDGTTTATGKMTVQDLQVVGKLTADLDLSGAGLDVKNLNVSEKATIKDLVVTGTTTGLHADVDGADIKPATVAATGGVSGSSLSSSGSLTVSGDATMHGDLTVDGQFKPDSLKTGNVEATGLSIAAGTATVQNLVVTGTTTGVKADIDGTAVKPSTVETTGGVNVGATLTVGGKTTLKDVEFTGTVTGLDLDLSQKNLTVKSIAATDPSAFGDVSTENLTNSELIITEDIQVLRNILDAEGKPVNTFDVTGKDILPNSVQSATSVKTKTLEVSQTTDLKGAVKMGAGLTITDGDIVSAQGKATFNDVQVNGALTDSEGNAIGSVESIKNKDIEPRSVVASTSVTAQSLESTGDIRGKSLTVTEDTATKNLNVSTLSTLSELRVSAKTTGKNAEFENIRIKRVAGTTGAILTVEGAAAVNGDLVVDGVITGIVDLSAQDITMNSLKTTQDITSRNVTASGTVTGQNGVFGADGQLTQIGIQSKSSASVAGNLTVGGDVKVTGSITGNIDLSGKDLNAKTLTATGEVKAATLTATDKVVTKDLTVTGTTTFAQNAVFNAGQVKSKLFTVDPGADLTVGSGTWTPDGLQSVYNVVVSADTVIQPLASLPGAGTYYFYIEQDGTGGHNVTFAAPYLQIGTDTVNTAPSSVSLVQVIYRGKGNLFDYVVLRRG